MVPLADGQFLTLFTDNLFIDILLLFLFLLLFSFLLSFPSPRRTRARTSSDCGILKKRKSPAPRKRVSGRKIRLDPDRDLDRADDRKDFDGGTGAVFLHVFIANRFWAIVTGIAAVAFLTWFSPRSCPKQYTKENAEKWPCERRFHVHRVQTHLAAYFHLRETQAHLGKRAEQRKSSRR